VFLLSDGYLANGSEPWRLPDAEPDLTVEARLPTGPKASCPTAATPRPSRAAWAVPGTPGLEHRIGGIEKADDTGNISYDPDNHEKMMNLRREKVDRIADLPPPRSSARRAAASCSCSAGAPPTAPSARR
jgi:2-oxoglutarate ferredoxin oxidoreductase subunit alpha